MLLSTPCLWRDTRKYSIIILVHAYTTAAAGNTGALFHPHCMLFHVLFLQFSASARGDNMYLCSHTHTQRLNIRRTPTTSVDLHACQCCFLSVQCTYRRPNRSSRILNASTSSSVFFVAPQYLPILVVLATVTVTHVQVEDSCNLMKEAIN